MTTTAIRHHQAQMQTISRAGDKSVGTRGIRAFTLIELLTVIVIVGIILAVGIPAFTNLMKSSGLTTATRQVANTMTLARQYAITKRTKVYVVFPYRDTDS